MFRTIRNNWKKSLVGFCALSYGAKWSYDRYQANEIRQFYCRQASLFGSRTIGSMSHVNRIAVLLNGKANNGKAKSIYDKTIFPLLHLIGIDVRVYRLDTITDAAGFTDLLANKIEPNELSALMVVGGDGTISELMPHFLQSSTLQHLPICLVPIGEHASFARRLFPRSDQKKIHDDIALLCESVFALFNGTVVKRPLLKITSANTEDKPIYASSFDFGHYSRLEQLQRRLWYFSYLKYPISSVYHFLINGSRSVLSAESPSSIVYARPCSGCLRCQPALMDHYHTSQQQQREQKPTFFSRVYQSNRSTTRSNVQQAASPPVENPDCGMEYSLDLPKAPIELSATTSNSATEFQLNISDELERFNYDHEKIPWQSTAVRQIRFQPNEDLLSKHLLINHDKPEPSTPGEYRIELSEKTLNFIQISPDLLIHRPAAALRATSYELEEEALEKKGIFLFTRRRHSMPSS